VHTFNKKEITKKQKKEKRKGNIDCQWEKEPIKPVRPEASSYPKSELDVGFGLMTIRKSPRL